ncbi:flagellar biosynthetic protein FliO [Microbacterium oryzae]|uniref:flagellar biosynthetic protein FliO n=1 Tax=Microbacterium oryzae TaxID=743009 RepID=UPI0025B0ADD0|nr:flagellar biosynthetic protein FliO [Microbacterium oryzae]MDN3309644.1 flagellar biosynthetic protein FliO [Microbacterium oryzae]
MADLLVALRVIVSLAAVLGLLWWLSRRLQDGQETGGSPLAGLVPKKLARLQSLLPARSAPRAPQERITVVARSGLGGKAQLVVAEFGGIRYVLGVTEHGVSVVDTQEALPQEALPQEALEPEEATPDTPDTPETPEPVELPQDTPAAPALRPRLRRAA